jgi:putative ABC transport system substrate-binding protein
MKIIPSARVSDSYSDNRKSKTCPEFCRRIQNRKWLELSVFAFVLVLAGAAAQAQQPAQVPRIGYLFIPPLSTMTHRSEAFRRGLSELGYVEGKTIAVEWRSSEGDQKRLRALVAELLHLKVDVIVSGGSAVTRVVKEATSTIPIVMAQDSDPVGNRFVASLASPGGNITGLSTVTPEIRGKQLDLLIEIVPRMSRVAVFQTSTQPGNAQAVKEVERAAGASG